MQTLPSRTASFPVLAAEQYLQDLSECSAAAEESDEEKTEVIPINGLDIVYNGAYSQTERWPQRVLQPFSVVVLIAKTLRHSTRPD